MPPTQRSAPPRQGHEKSADFRRMVDLGGVENGHWVLVVSKEDFQIGFDAWGYREGELKGRVHALIPEGPLVITAHKIAQSLYLYEGKATLIFC